MLSICPEETPESQHEKKEKMKGMSRKADTNPEEVKDLMKLTYYTQRQHVNQDAMFSYVEETSLAGEMEMEQVPLTSSILVRGKTLVFLCFYCIFLILFSINLYKKSCLLC